MVFEYCYRIFFCASPDVRMCNQMGFKQIMCVFLPLSFVSYVWFLSRKILNRRAHSYFGNTTVYSCPVCAKSFKTLAGLKRHEQSGIHEFEKKARKNKTLLDYFTPKKKSKSQKRKREECDTEIRWGMVPKRKQRKKAEQAKQRSKGKMHEHRKNC